MSMILHNPVERLKRAEDGFGLIFLRRIAVIRVTASSHLDFNDVFQTEFSRGYPDAAFASILLSDVSRTNDMVRSFVARALTNIGFDASAGIYPGY